MVIMLKMVRTGDSSVKSEGVPVQLNSALRERLQDTDKNNAIELYFELLSSGHSVGDILEALNSTQSKSVHDGAVTVEYTRAKPNKTPTNIAAEISSVQQTQAKTWCTLDLSNSHAAGNGRTEQAQAAESTQLKERASDNGDQLPDDLCGSEADILASAGSRTSANCDATHCSGDPERIRPGKLPEIAKSIAIRTFYAAAVASAAVVGFSILPVVRDAQISSVSTLSSISGGIETAVVPRAEAGRSEAFENMTLENTTKPKKPAVDADLLRAPESLRPLEPDPTVPSPADRSAAEVRATDSAAQPQAQEPDGSQVDQSDATGISAGAATFDPSMRQAAPAAAPTQAAESANDAEPTRAHAVAPAAAAKSATLTTQGPRPDPEPRASASIASLEAEHRIGGDRAGTPAASPAETALAEEPDAAHPPASGSAAVAPEPRIAEIAPENPQFKTMTADALVVRGDTFFATGDLASARLFYEHAAAAGNATAALRLGGTFDPSFLARARIDQIQADAAIALYWYRRARDLGNGDAQILLKKMEKPTR